MFNTKWTKFYHEDYYTVDLLRVCELEETITEWYDLPLGGIDAALENYGFRDLLNHHEDFEYILTSFQEVFEIQSLEVGGTYFRVLKVQIRSTVKDKSYYPLIDSYIEIKDAQEIICNEVKRSGFLIDSQH